MKKIITVILFSTVFVLNGCIVQFTIPLFDDSKAVKFPQLNGYWKLIKTYDRDDHKLIDANQKINHWSFDNSQALIFDNQNRGGIFEYNIYKIDDLYLMQFQPSVINEYNDYYDDLTEYKFSLAKVIIENDILRIFLIKQEFFKFLFDNNEIKTIKLDENDPDAIDIDWFNTDWEKLFIKYKDTDKIFETDLFLEFKKSKMTNGLKLKWKEPFTEFSAQGYWLRKEL